ncbi:MAG: hypothetical protein AKCLJLPJ_01167 [Fimbriimonadales bacterium]|nr:hypothetical protein [Fimbriimonadales bacterium]
MRRMLLTLMLAATGMCVGAWAQVSGSNYRLQPEDFISLSIYGEEGMRVEAPVGLDGNISVPFLGLVAAAGKTTTELANFVRSELISRDYFKNPLVTVNIVRYRPLRASVVGFAQKAGQYEFKPGDRLLTLISQAGGTLPTSDLRRATLVRKGSVEQIPIDLRAMLEKGDLSQNYELQDGDVLNIPRRYISQVNVLGYVPRPGQFEWYEGMTLAEALALAQGEIPYRSKLSAIQIQRQVPGRASEWRRFTVDFTKFVTKNDFTQNVVLQPGDVIYVPSTSSPDLDRASQIANIVFTVQSLLSRNFNFFPRF